MWRIFLPIMAFFCKAFSVLLPALLPEHERRVVRAYIPSIYFAPPSHPMAFIRPAAFFLRAVRDRALNAVVPPSVRLNRRRCPPDHGFREERMHNAVESGAEKAECAVRRAARGGLLGAGMGREVPHPRRVVRRNGRDSQLLCGIRAGGGPPAAGLRIVKWAADTPVHIYGIYTAAPSEPFSNLYGLMNNLRSAQGAAAAVKAGSALNLGYC